jgi:hypothetical protein
VKTVTGIPQNTSNIWSPLPELRDVVDEFLIVHLDAFELVPRATFRLPVAMAAAFWLVDKHQRCGKLKIDERFQSVAAPL